MNRLVAKFAAFVSRKRGNFLTFHERPIRAENVALLSETEPTPRIAIVLQGPLLHTDDFTVETVRMYRKRYPSHDIIVSTWKGEHADAVDRLRQEGAIVLLNDPPERPGISHTNYQIVSTNNGIAEAKQRGAAYVLKTRTDQRIYAPHADRYLLDLMESFPVATVFSQEKRLIVSSFITFMYRLYAPTDMLMFGTLADMERYWNSPLDERMAPPPGVTTLRDWSKAAMCEAYLGTQFLKRIGRPLAWTLADSWGAYRDHFCVADAETLDTYWPKYDALLEYRFRNYQGTTAEMLSFKEWLRLYRDPSCASEAVLDLPLGAPLPNTA